MTLMPPSASPLGAPVLPDSSLRHAIPAGSRVLMSQGEAPIETLVPGDRIITRDHGMTAIRDLIRLDVEPGTMMIRIPLNALGIGKPDRDVMLLPDQPVVLRNWRARTIFRAKEARVAAQRLIDGSVIRPVPFAGGPVWCIVLDRPSAIYVDGLELVSGAKDAMIA
ncbi:Hint domain-containing protein [Jannaschia faecimaris]|uniref:Hint domain-containing protein n=1 Tax=Jannaschia faecimaris TaxID=1244108 RepID=A0A1H3TH63_9RHOB|nr:Hint domain-containing protein [Jannaschia faecimaris]SDZ49623.1 Hint domain-containing protein [Jannaschia faecimaris]